MYIVFMVVFLNINYYLEEKVFRCTDIVNIRETNELVAMPTGKLVETCSVWTKQLKFRVQDSCHTIVSRYREYCK